jgi:hypothetical protein
MVAATEAVAMAAGMVAAMVMEFAAKCTPRLEYAECTPQ